MAAAPVLLDPYQVHIEHYLMAETLFVALLVGGLALLVWHDRPSPALERVRPRFHEGIARALHEYQERAYTPDRLWACSPRSACWPASAGSRPPCAASVGRRPCSEPAACASTFDYRYLLPSLPLLGPAGAMDATLLSARWRREEGGGRHRRRRRSPWSRRSPR